jgi:hypothetical protein
MLDNAVVDVDILQDYVYDFAVQQPYETRKPIVHWFELTRAGRGWSVADYYRRERIVACPISTHCSTTQQNVCHTLSQIQNAFSQPRADDGTVVFQCVVSGHLTVPTTIYQLVIENLTASMRDQFCRYIVERRGGEGLTHDYHLERRWVSGVPKGVISEWLAS